MMYVVLHNNPEGLVLPPEMRERLFATGNVVGIVECSTYSLQPEHIERYKRWPLTLLLWGMADRYEVAAEAKVEVIEVRDWSEAYRCCQVR